MDKDVEIVFIRSVGWKLVIMVVDVHRRSSSSMAAL